MIRRGFSSLLVCLLVAALASSGSPATAADPNSGIITAASTRVEWTGEYRDAAKGSGCSRPVGDPLEYCDRYTLTVDLPGGYWQSGQDGLLVQIVWPDPTDAFRLCVVGPTDRICEGEGAVVAGRFGSLRVFFPEAVSGTYEVAVQYEAVVASGYEGVAAALVAEPEPEEPRFDPPVLFDRETVVDFGPATVVSPHFLGTEPMMALERPTVASSPGALDRDRIFVDWPLGSTSGIGQLSRSDDGGDSFRLLFDIENCPERSRPNCDTTGGGDTDVAVNPANGNVYFTDLESLGNVALASSTDHGDTFPSARQHVISAPATAIDRQWVTGALPRTVEVDHDQNPTTPKVGIEAFMSYEVGLLRKAIQGIDESGRPIPQEIPQIPDGSGRTGPVRVDTTKGPAHGWLYHPAGAADANGRYGVATVHASNYQKSVGEPGGWEVNVVADRPGRIPLFSWLELDAAGNAYTVWLQEPDSIEADPAWRIHYSFSDLNDPRNRPPAGRPGTAWSAPVTVSLPEVGSTIFPQVTAGDAGRIAITYMGTTEHVGDPQEAPPGTKWDVYAAILTDAVANSGSLRVATGKVNHRTAHTGSICWGGAGCEVGVPDDPTGLSGGGDRSLADMMDVGMDATGRVAVVYGDNHSTFAYMNPSLKEKPFPHFVKQVSGPSLLEASPDVQVAQGQDRAADPRGDSTWPNAMTGRWLPTLDVLDASLRLEGDELVARVGLQDASPGLMTQDLASYADSYPAIRSPRRVQYVLRFLTESEIYHLSMQHKGDGSRRFFGGRLDQNDRLMTSDAYEYVNGAGYHTDPDKPVTGAVEGNTLVLRGRAADFGIAEGTEVFSVTAFAMAGPTEDRETTISDIMRTIDATPPFDAIMSRGDPDEDPTPEPTPEPSADPTATPTPDGSIHQLSLSPEEMKGRVGTGTMVTATAIDAEGDPVPGAAVEWSSVGVGHFVDTETLTDATGRARATVASEEPGDQRVIVSAASCTPSGECSDEAVRHHGPLRCAIFGTRGPDLIWGTDAADIICPFGGNDVVFAGIGNDIVRDRGGNDRIYGEVGRDRIFGGRGADDLRAGRGADLLVGGRGSDLMFGGRGRDRCRGTQRDYFKSCRF